MKFISSALSVEQQKVKEQQFALINKIPPQQDYAQIPDADCAKCK
jgi:hypothetical protein